MGFVTGSIASGILTSLIAVFIYDAIITMGEEIRCFWGRKLTGAAVLFWLNKYMTALLFAWLLAGSLAVSEQVRSDT